jgi:hypothetical protein
MKDEEMAEQFADNISGLELTCSLLSAKDKSHAYRLGRYDGFLAGLKAGRPQWHKVADGDLPKVGVQVLSEQGTLVVYKGDGFNWVEYSPNADSIRLRKWEEPIAWCEIPTFDKE